MRHARHGAFHVGSKPSLQPPALINAIYEPQGAQQAVERWLLKPQLPTSNYNPNAGFVSHFTPSLGGFPLALSPFEVAADYRAGSVIISLWKVFGAGGKEINHPRAGLRTGVGD